MNFIKVLGIDINITRDRISSLSHLASECLIKVDQQPRLFQ